MLQLQLNPCLPGRDNRRKENKGCAVMKESTVLPEWEKNLFFFVVIVVEQNEKSFRLKCSSESV